MGFNQQDSENLSPNKPPRQNPQNRMPHKRPADNTEENARFLTVTKELKPLTPKQKRRRKLSFGKPTRKTRQPLLGFITHQKPAHKAPVKIMHAQSIPESPPSSQSSPDSARSSSVESPSSVLMHLKLDTPPSSPQMINDQASFDAFMQKQNPTYTQHWLPPQQQRFARHSRELPQNPPSLSSMLQYHGYRLSLEFTPRLYCDQLATFHNAKSLLNDKRNIILVLSDGTKLDTHNEGLIPSHTLLQLLAEPGIRNAFGYWHSTGKNYYFRLDVAGLLTFLGFELKLPEDISIPLNHLDLSFVDCREVTFEGHGYGSILPKTPELCANIDLSEIQSPWCVSGLTGHYNLLQHGIIKLPENLAPDAPFWFQEAFSKAKPFSLKNAEKMSEPAEAACSQLHEQYRQHISHAQKPKQQLATQSAFMMRIFKPAGKDGDTSNRLTQASTEERCAVTPFN